MRKFSRIFAALLSICLVIGAVMVVALAEAPASTTDLGFSDDYEGYSAGDKDINNLSGGAKYSSTEIISDAANDNKYLQLSYLESASRQYEIDYNFAAYPNTMISDYSYFTVDFDICADKYVYTLNGETEMGETVPEDATDVKLAYFDGMYFLLENRPIINGSPYYSGSKALQVNLNYDSEASAWRIYVDTRATDYYLSNELGSWNHFTYAVKVIEKDGSYGYSEIRLYFDGYLIGTTTINSGAGLKKATDIALKSLNWYIGNKNSPVNVPYSMGVDNYTPTFYPAGYVSSEKYGIDDLFEDADITKSIAYCNDVVYSSDYISAGNPFISIDAGISYCGVPAIMSDIFASMRNGTIIETNMKLHDFTPPAGVDSFEVYLRDGGEFSLSKEAAQELVQKLSPLGYRVSKLSTDDAIVINWLDSKGGNLIKSELLTAETAPVFAYNNLPVFDFEKGIISESKVTNWLWDLDGEGNSDLGLDNPEESIRKLSDAEIKIVKQYCGGVIDIYPESVEEVGTTELAYAIEYKNANGHSLALVDSNGAYDEYADISTFAANVSNAPDGATVYVYKSGSVNDTVTVGEGIELCIDLRGAALDFTADIAFVLSNDSVLNVYSSVEGASLIFSDVGFSTVGGSKGFNNCDVVIGAYGEFLGDNLSVSAETVFEIVTSYTGANDVNDINVAIDCNLLEGSFYFAASDVNVVINNTEISGSVIFNSDSSVEVFTALEVDVDISDCRVSARALVGEWGEGSVISIESSLVDCFAALSEDVEGDVVFGADNALTYDVRAEGDFVSAEDGIAFANASLSMGEEGEYLVSILTFEIAAASSEDYVLVVWNDALGNEFVSDYYHKSLSYANSPLTSEMTDTSKFPIVEDLENGWYDIGYTSWKNTAEGSVDNAIVMGATNVFIPVANGPVASLDFMVNAALRTTEVGLNLYVEIPGEGIIVDVESALYYVDDEGMRVQTTLLTGFAGAEGYYAYELPLAVASFDAREAFIVFAVSGFDGNGDGVVENTEEDYVILFKEFSIDFMVYAETAAELYACGTDDSKLIFDLVQYKYNAYLASVAEEDVDEKIVERVSALLDSHGEGCECATDLESLEFTDKEIDAAIDEVVSDKILAARVDFENGKPALYFYVDASIDVESFSIKHKGLEYQAGGWDYINHKLICEPVAIGEGEINGVACVIYEYEDILLCNVSAIMNITLEINTGDEAAPVIETVSTSCSLASYIEASEDNTLAKALYAASKSALEYRFVREGE